MGMYKTTDEQYMFDIYNSLKKNGECDKTDEPEVFYIYRENLQIGCTLFEEGKDSVLLVMAKRFLSDDLNHYEKILSVGKRGSSDDVVYMTGNFKLLEKIKNYLTAN